MSKHHNIPPRRVERKVVMGSHPSSPRFWSAWQRQGYEVSTAHRNPWSRREEFVDGRLVGGALTDGCSAFFCCEGHILVSGVVFGCFFLGDGGWWYVPSIFSLWIHKDTFRSDKSWLIQAHYHRILYHLERIRWPRILIHQTWEWQPLRHRSFHHGVFLGREESARVIHVAPRKL